MKNIIIIVLSLLFIDVSISQNVLQNQYSDHTKVSGIMNTSLDSECYKTVDRLLVTKEGNDFVDNGKSAIYVAENSIIFSDGFIAAEGSSMHAFIISNFCPAQPESILTTQINGYELVDQNNQVFLSGSQSILDENSMKIYPNPTNGRFYIDFMNQSEMDIDIQIIDFGGQEIQRLNSNNQQQLEIDLSSLSKGTYTVFIRNAKNVITRKIVKI